LTKIFGDTADILANTNTIITNLATVSAVTNALPTLTETGGTVTTDGTEQNVYIDDVPLGVFRPVCVKIDFTNHTAGETVIVREYYRIKAGIADPILQDEVTYAGVPANPLITIDLTPNRYGARVTIEKTAGANRAYDWGAFYEI